MSLDPRCNAVRPDLADIRLAEYVFAPHYAAPLVMAVRSRAMLRDVPGGDGVVVAMVEAGTEFEMLDQAKGYAWGVCKASGLVGYIERAALSPVNPGQ